MGWASFHKVKGHQFLPSGHVPGLWVSSLVGGVQEATDQCFSLTMMFLSLSLKISKINNKNISKIIENRILKTYLHSHVHCFINTAKKWKSGSSLNVTLNGYR